MEPQSVREASERIDVLLDEVGQGAPPAVAARVTELVQCVMAVYGEGLRRVRDAVDDGVLQTLAADEVVGNLLVLHDLHPDDVDTRVQRALETVRPYLGSHAGGVSLSGVDEAGVVHLRLEGSCDGCPSSAVTVRHAIEEAVLAAAPDVVAVETEGVVEETGRGTDVGPVLLQIGHRPPDSWGPAAGADTGWHHLDLDVPPRTMAAYHVAGSEVLVANVDGTLVAYADRCPACGAVISSGSLDGDVVTCPGGHAYDARLAGRSRTDGTGHMTPFPLLPERGGWKVSLPTPAPIPAHVPEGARA